MVHGLIRRNKLVNLARHQLLWESSLWPNVLYSVAAQIGSFRICSGSTDKINGTKRKNDKSLAAHWAVNCANYTGKHFADVFVFLFLNLKFCAPNTLPCQYSCQPGNLVISQINMIFKNDCLYENLIISWLWLCKLKDADPECQRVMCLPKWPMTKSLTTTTLILLWLHWSSPITRGTTRDFGPHEKILGPTSMHRPHKPCTITVTTPPEPNQPIQSFKTLNLCSLATLL